MDVVWLKKDVRIHDHGPLAEITRSNNPFCILYLFEPDQLSESSVHGSHILFINEGLVDLDRTLSGSIIKGECKGGCKVGVDTILDDNTPSTCSINTNQPMGDSSKYRFQVITVCHANAVYTFNTIHRRHTINRILCHEETGHFKSFIRDKTVRKWCKKNQIPIVEYNQTGVTRCLKDRDDFATKLNVFLSKPLYHHDVGEVGAGIESPMCSGVEGENGLVQGKQVEKNHLYAGDTVARNAIVNACRSYSCPCLENNINSTNNSRSNCSTRIVKNLELHGRIYHPIQLQDITEIPIEHRIDRIDREQKGGETNALQTLQSFLSHRGSFYAAGISSPNTSWTSGSRLSPYLTWGHISLRFVIQKTRERQCYLREEKKKQKKNSNKSYNNTTKNSGKDEYWLKSLQAFSSRIHWRSHFIQKLESEPQIEKRDLCPAYQHLRRQEHDWNQSYYDAWSTGQTGFPFVDACMRCLLRYGWLNFRMRAMLVSFATYNLWLDWKRIAPHLARVFLDYEPGIHYPQLQMQSGTTGINAMRVYNVTKQGKDQDPDGVFIRKFVPELKNVPLKYIHEPNKMPCSLQEKIQVFIQTIEPSKHSDILDDGDSILPKKSQNSSITSIGLQENVKTQTQSLISKQSDDKLQQPKFYPRPIVDERESAKIAKDKVAAVRKQETTKELAQQVYIKHGSRSNKEREMGNIRTKGNNNNITPSKQQLSSSSPAAATEAVSSPPLKKAKVDSPRNSQKTILDLFSKSTCAKNRCEKKRPADSTILSKKESFSSDKHSSNVLQTKTRSGQSMTNKKK